MCVYTCVWYVYIPSRVVSRQGCSSSFYYHYLPNDGIGSGRGVSARGTERVDRGSCSRSDDLVFYCF